MMTRVPGTWRRVETQYVFVIESVVKKNYFARPITLLHMSALQDSLLIVKTTHSRAASLLGCREDLESES